jgi:hypothetical protein
MPQGTSYPNTFLRNDNSWQDPITNNLVPANPVYPYKSIFTALFAALGLTRTLLTAATTFYIATNGSDANNGLTSGAPWLTFAHAMSQILNNYDFGGQTVTLQAVAGHAAFTGSGLHISPWTGGGAFVFDGGGGSIAVTNDNAIDAVEGALPGLATVQNVTLSTSGSSGTNTTPLGRGILVENGAKIIVGIGVTFSTCVSTQAQAANSAFLLFVKNYSINGGGLTHWTSSTAGLIVAENLVITLTGTPAFGQAFCFSGTGGSSLVAGNTFSGAATGPKFFVINAGSILTGNAGPTYLPGSVAGTVTSPGSYS